MVFASSDLLGVKIDAKKGDITGNFKVCVRCWGWLVGGGKVHIIRIDLITDFVGQNRR